MAISPETHKPNVVPDLAQHYRAEIEAVLKDPATVIEQRYMPAAVNGQQRPWSGSETGTSAILSMLDPGNWREGSEFRVRPPGVHGYAVFGKREKLSLAYVTLYDREVLPEHLGSMDLCLHIELDPSDPVGVRKCEVLKPAEGEAAE